jgi:hypothetical protein
VERVDLPAREHLRERAVRRDRCDVHALGQVEPELFHPARRVQAAGAVADRLDRHAVVLGEDAADPHRRGDLVLRHPHQSSP